MITMLTFFSEWFIMPCAILFFFMPLKNYKYSILWKYICCQTKVVKPSSPFPDSMLLEIKELCQKMIFTKIICIDWFRYKTLAPKGTWSTSPYIHSLLSTQYIKIYFSHTPLFLSLSPHCHFLDSQFLSSSLPISHLLLSPRLPPHLFV